jgi:hypothetical protein
LQHGTAGGPICATSPAGADLTLTLSTLGGIAAAGSVAEDLSIAWLLTLAASCADSPDAGADSLSSLFWMPLRSCLPLMLLMLGITADLTPQALCLTPS